MKKIFATAVLAMSVFFTTAVQAEVKFGLKGGLNVTSMSLSSDVLGASNRAGFFIGPTVKFTLPIVGLGIDASALYDQREAKVKVSDVESNLFNETSNTLKTQSINIPINLRYGIGLGSSASVFIFAGPQFGFNVGSKTQEIYEGMADWKLKTSNFSVNVGLGFMLLNHLQVSANYNIACGKTGEVTLGNVASSVTKGLTDSNGRANAWQIALAYYF
jgi:hypothetical protein